MGNRAVITGKDSDYGIYLQWNGGRDSVEAFLEYSRLKGHPGITGEGEGLFALATIITNFFGNNGLHIYPMKGDDAREADVWDNGVYIIEGNEIIERRAFEGEEQNQYKMEEMLKNIDERQPAEFQLGADYLDAVETPAEELEVGDDVMVINLHGKVEKKTVIGKNEKGAYTNRYSNHGDPTKFDDNPNNYFKGVVRVKQN